MYDEEAQWPSVDWARHHAGCMDVPRCRHQPHLPAWWRSLMYRGDPGHPDTEAALADAIYRVGRYKGHPRLPSDAADFTRRAVLDALPAAPQPVQAPWVNYSLTIVGGLARWAVATGQPITREHLLTERVIARYVHQFHADKPGGTRAGYISRLELIAGLLIGHRPESVPITQDPPGLPLTREQEADAWQWARSLSTSLRRHQMKTIIAFGRGAGLHRSELGHARPEHVTRDEHGVHVHIATRGTGRIRRVTVDAEWEDRVAALAGTVPPGRMMLRPSSDRPYASALTGPCSPP